MNKVIIKGRMTRDAELKRTNSGKDVTSFSVAVDKLGGNGAIFVNCVAWEKTAVFISSYFHKGNNILIDGHLDVRSYEDKDGNKRNIAEVIADRVEFCESRGSDIEPMKKANEHDPFPPALPREEADKVIGNIQAAFDGFTEVSDDLPF